MFIIYFDIFYHACFCESMHVSRGALGGRTVHGILWITVRKIANIGAGNGAYILWKSSKYF